MALLRDTKKTLLSQTLRYCIAPIIFLVFLLFLLFFFPTVVRTRVPKREMKLTPVDILHAATVSERQLANLTSIILLLEYETHLSTRIRAKLLKQLADSRNFIEGFLQGACATVWEEESDIMLSNKEGLLLNNNNNNNNNMSEAIIDFSRVCKKTERRLGRWKEKIDKLLGKRKE